MWYRRTDVKLTRMQTISYYYKPTFVRPKIPHTFTPCPAYYWKLSSRIEKTMNFQQLHHCWFYTLVCSKSFCPSTSILPFNQLLLGYLCVARKTLYNIQTWYCQLSLRIERVTNFHYVLCSWHISLSGVIKLFEKEGFAEVHKGCRSLLQYCFMHQASISNPLCISDFFSWNNFLVSYRVETTSQTKDNIIENQFTTEQLTMTQRHEAHPVWSRKESLCKLRIIMHNLVHSP